MALTFLNAKGVATLWGFPNGWCMMVEHHKSDCAGYTIQPSAVVTGQLRDRGEGDHLTVQHATDADVAKKLAEVASWPTEPSWQQRQNEAKDMADAAIAKAMKKST